METTTKNSTVAFINLSTLSQYFIPFGNFIFPIIIWSTNKDKSEYIDQQGKDTINFQLSLLIYSFVLALIAIPILLITFFQNVSFTAFANGNDFHIDHFNFSQITGVVSVALFALFLFIFMKVAEFFLIIYASLKTSNGDSFKYPLTIPFLK